MKKLFFAALAATMLASCNSGNVKLDTEIDSLSYEFGMLTSPGDYTGMYLMQQGSDSTCVDEYVKGYQEGLALADDSAATVKELARYAGLQAGLQIARNIRQAEMQIFQGDSTKSLNLQLVSRGHIDATKKQVCLKNAEGETMTQQNANEHLMEYMFRDQRKTNEEWLAKKLTEKDVVKVGTQGLAYKVLTEGNAAGAHPALTSTVEIVYEGKLIDGTVFDATARHGRETDEMPLASTVDGWKQILPLMTEGAEWEIYIPAALGYKDRGTQAIKPYSTLIFKVKLVKANVVKE